MNWNLASVWESVADIVPERTALVSGTTRRSWAEFDERAARLAAALDAAGLGPTSKVAQYAYNSNEYSEGVYATLKLRAVPVNVNYRYTEDELLYLLENSDAEALIFHGSLGEQVAKVLGRAPRLKLAIQIDDGSPLLDGCATYEDLIAAHAPAARVERNGDDLYFLYTGGTTGMPKGVMWRNEDLFGTLAESIYPLQGLEMPSTSRAAGELAAQIAVPPVHLPGSPLMHGTGAFTTFQTLFLGGTVVTLTKRSFDAHEMWDAVQREKVTQMAIVGDAFCKPMIAALEEGETKGAPYDTTSLGLLVSSGVMWSAESKAQIMALANCICLDSLGSSEGVGFGNSMSAPGAEAKTAKFTIGGKAAVLREDGTPVEPGSGEIGVLALGGHIPLGYYKDEVKSAGTFRVMGGVRYSVPGDMAQVESDGTITLLGRGSVCINSGGEKIFPEEIEEVVKLQPGVADCLCVGLPDDRFGEMVTAVVTPAVGATLDGDTLTAGLGSLARYKHPRKWVFTDQILRAPNGKADYKAAKTLATDS
jgi:3-oxocholest-4-en-26-oate---CoA ligase